LGHAFSLALTYLNAAMVHDVRGDLASVRTYAEQVIAVAGEHHFPLLLGGASCLRARLLVAEGRHAEGLARLAEGVGTWQGTGAELSVPYYLGLTAEMYRAAGDPEQARAAVELGLAAVERSDERSAEPELHRLRGELLAADPATSPEAEAAFRCAIALASRQTAVVFARRAAHAFAAYLRDRGRAPEAEEVLAEPSSTRAG
jgi:predicted ATPase